MENHVYSLNLIFLSLFSSISQSPSLDSSDPASRKGCHCLMVTRFGSVFLSRSYVFVHCKILGGSYRTFTAYGSQFVVIKRVQVETALPYMEVTFVSASTEF